LYKKIKNSKFHQLGQQLFLFQFEAQVLWFIVFFQSMGYSVFFVIFQEKTLDLDLTKQLMIFKTFLSLYSSRCSMIPIAQASIFIVFDLNSIQEYFWKSKTNQENWLNHFWIAKFSTLHFDGFAQASGIYFLFSLLWIHPLGWPHIDNIDE